MKSYRGYQLDSCWRRSSNLWLLQLLLPSCCLVTWPVGATNPSHCSLACRRSKIFPWFGISDSLPCSRIFFETSICSFQLTKHGPFFEVTVWLGGPSILYVLGGLQRKSSWWLVLAWLLRWISVSTTSAFRCWPSRWMSSFVPVCH